MAGRLNKQIATELGIALDTVKVHRARVMQKAGVDSLAELARRGSARGRPGRPNEPSRPDEPWRPVGPTYDQGGIPPPAPSRYGRGSWTS